MKTPSGREKPDYPGIEDIDEMTDRVRAFVVRSITWGIVRDLMYDHPKADAEELAQHFEINRDGELLP